MDFQNIMDSLSDSARRTRAQYHLTLGGLYRLAVENPDAVFVVADADCGLTNPHSYRGYYADLSFEQSDERAVTATAVKALCGRAKTETFLGYKGGEFTYDDDAPLWLAPDGRTGDAIIGYDATQPGVIKLITKEVF